MKEKIKKFFANDFTCLVTEMFVAFIVVFLLLRFVFILALIPTGSMYPTVPYPSINLGNRLAYLLDSPERGDIVYFQSEEMGAILIKRVIGVPGDTVEERNGEIYVNGVKIDEPYLVESPKDEDAGPFVVPEDCYFLMGDNRNNSYDARYWENPYICKTDIIAKHMLSFKILGMDSEESGT